MHAEKNNLELSVQLLSQGLSLHLDTLGDKHPKTLACYYQLARVCQMMGECKRAEYVSHLFNCLHPTVTYYEDIANYHNYPPLNRKILRLILATYTALSPQPKPELARTNFKLSQVLEQQGAPEDEWAAYRREARQSLAQILKGDLPEEDCEGDYDNRIAYFLR